MAKFESNVKQIPYSVESVYNILSDLSNLERLRGKVPSEKIAEASGGKISGFDFTADTDNLACNISPVGEVKLHVVERDPLKCIKLEATDSMLPFTLWIQVLPTSESSSKMRLTITTELNFMVKKMVEKPLKEGLEKIADVLSRIPYGEI